MLSTYTISTNNTGSSHLWNVPADLVASVSQIEVICTNATSTVNYSDSSDNTFEIINATSTVSVVPKDLPITTNQVTLLKAVENDKVYRIVDEKKIWIPNIQAFNNQQLEWKDVKEIDLTSLNEYQEANLLRAKGDEKVYYIPSTGLKKWIKTVEIFNSYNNKWEEVVEVDPEIINSFEDVGLISLQNDPKVYKIENGQKKWISTVEAFNRLKYDWDKISLVNEVELNAYADQGIIE